VFFDDLRYAWRGLRKQPSFSSIALITLALGIGVNTAVFSVFYAVLMRPLPYGDPSRVVVIWANFKTRGTAQVSVSGELFREIELRQRSMAALGGMWVTPPRTFPGDPPVQVKSAFVTTNFFDVLGVRASAGRTFARTDGGRPLVIFADTFWRRQFGADSRLVGSALNKADTLLGTARRFSASFCPRGQRAGRCAGLPGVGSELLFGEQLHRPRRGPPHAGDDDRRGAARLRSSRARDPRRLTRIRARAAPLPSHGGCRPMRFATSGLRSRRCSPVVRSCCSSAA
jgi:hypothetical protein